MRSLFAAALAASIALPSPNPVLPPTYVGAPNACLTLETAATPQEQERGLMDRTTLAPQHGMMFTFARDATVSFWMKDTLIPLDMVFAASDFRVRKVFTNVAVVPPGTPDDAIPLETARARYVIELRAGEAALDGITSGVRLHVLSRCAGTS